MSGNQKKRDRDSEGDTPKPQHKMATTGGNSPSPAMSITQDSELGKTLTDLLSTVQDLKKGQDSLKRVFEKKIDKLRNDLMESIDAKVKSLRDEFSLDMARESSRIDTLISSVQSLQGRVSDIEIMQDNGTMNADLSNGTAFHRRGQLNPLNDPEVTVIASGLQFTDDENILSKASELIGAIGGDVAENVLVTAAARLPSKFRNKPGLVKISFGTVDEKVLVLRNKMNLKNSTVFKNVFLKSSKSHAERLIELNARAILKELPQGRSLRVDSNGRIKPRSGNRAEAAAFDADA